MSIFKLTAVCVCVYIYIDGLVLFRCPDVLLSDILIWTLLSPFLLFPDFLIIIFDSFFFLVVLVTAVVVNVVVSVVSPVPHVIAVDSGLSVDTDVGWMVVLLTSVSGVDVSVVVTVVCTIVLVLVSISDVFIVVTAGVTVVLVLVSVSDVFTVVTAGVTVVLVLVSVSDVLIDVTAGVTVVLVLVSISDVFIVVTAGVTVVFVLISVSVPDVSSVVALVGITFVVLVLHVVFGEGFVVCLSSTIFITFLAQTLSGSEQITLFILVWNLYMEEKIYLTF